MTTKPPAKKPGRRSGGHRGNHTGITNSGGTKQPTTKKAHYTRAQNRAFRRYIRTHPTTGLDGLPACTFVAAGEYTSLLYGSRMPLERLERDFLASGPADRGRALRDVLELWKAKGIGGHKIRDFEPVGLDQSGPVLLSIALPYSAIDQFRAGVPWDDIGDYRIHSCHAVLAVGDEIRTWNETCLMTPAFRRAYALEAWGIT